MRNSHKHVVEVVSDFCARTRPNTRHRVQLQELLIGFVDVLDDRNLKTICGLLSNSEYAPKLLVVALCMKPVDICQALLVASPVPGHGEFMTIIDQRGIEHARAIARNPAISRETASLLRSLNDQRVDRALDLRQQPIITSTGATKPAGYKVEQVETMTEAENTFENLYREHADNIIHTAISDKLGLSVSSVRIICSDFTSRNLPTTFKFLGLSGDGAWNLYRRLAGDFANSAGVETAFRGKYAAIDRRQAQSVISAWQIEELATNARYGNVANQQNGPSRAEGKIA